MISSQKVIADRRLQESAMLLATYNSDKQLRIYRVDLDFVHLRIALQHVKVLNHCLPLNDVNEGALSDHGALPLHAELSHLEFTPPGPRTDNKEWRQPFILASFSYVSENLQGPPAHAAQLTIICKWQLQYVPPKLHPSFDSLSSKKVQASSNVDLPVSHAFCIQSLVDSYVWIKGRLHFEAIK